jgi:hypothetical protein
MNSDSGALIEVWENGLLCSEGFLRHRNMLARGCTVNYINTSYTNIRRYLV